MNRFSLVGTVLSAAAILVGVTDAQKASDNPVDTLEGVLRVHPRFHYRYFIEGFGDGQECALFGADKSLQQIKPGSLIRVRGDLASKFLGQKDGTSALISTWIIYMDVDQVEVLRGPVSRAPLPSDSFPPPSATSAERLLKDTHLKSGDISNAAEPFREALRPALEGGGSSDAQPAASPARAGAQAVPREKHLFNDKYSAIGVMSDDTVHFVLIYTGFLSTGMQSWVQGNGADTKWGFAGSVHLVDVEKTRAAGKGNVDKRQIAVKFTSDASDTLFLDGKAYDLSRPVRATSMGALAMPGRIFILRDKGEPLQSDRTLPLRSEKGLVIIGDFAERDRFLMETYAESRRVQAMEGWVLAWDVQDPIKHGSGQRKAILRIFPDGRVLSLPDGRNLKELKLSPAELAELLRWLVEERQLGEWKPAMVKVNGVEFERAPVKNMWDRVTDILFFMRDGKRHGIVVEQGKPESAAFEPIREVLNEMLKKARPVAARG
ncbi:MAG: hypothetical protein H8E44_18640 [Planctomycetes bacterium]|nr:hypothetical protein [Planctomycetota bacterium]MBL7044933.1 hypothetical protein [Pirellulaceae bacterium]